MKRTLRYLSITFLVLGVGLAAFLVPTIWGKPWSIDHFYMRTMGVYALRHPELLTYLGVLEAVGLEFHNDDLDDRSEAFAEREARWVESELATLRSYDRSSLDSDRRLSYDVMEWFLADGVEAARWRHHDYPLNQLDGVQAELPDFMVNDHSLDSARAADNYVRRVRQFAVVFDQVLEGLAIRQDLGVVPPRFVIDRVLEEIRVFTGVNARDNLLYTHFATATQAIEGLSEDTRGELLRRLEDAIGDDVYPAYGRLTGFLEKQRALATDEAGVWKLPQGDAYYAYLLRSHTTTGLSARELHDLGLAELEAIHAELRSLLESQGYAVERPGPAIQALSREQRFLYVNDDTGRERILADYRSLVDDAARDAPNLFRTLPESEVVVRRIPEFREESAPIAQYTGPSLGEGGRPGVFWVNLRDLSQMPKFRMRTLVYHEAIPGHHLQVARALELDDVPFFRRIIPFTAYSEGWGLYAETLAAEAGYLEDPFDRIGYLSDQALRAARLVVDTGIHSQRWTREASIAYLVDATGMPEADATAEVERYIVNPGQATAYKVGQLEILRLREEARAQLGERFDLRAFHDLVLGAGALPLAVLRARVMEWIERSRP